MTTAAAATATMSSPTVAVEEETVAMRANTVDARAVVLLMTTTLVDLVEDDVMMGMKEGEVDVRSPNTAVVKKAAMVDVKKRAMVDARKEDMVDARKVVTEDARRRDMVDVKKADTMAAARTTTAAEETLTVDVKREAEDSGTCPTTNAQKEPTQRADATARVTASQVALPMAAVVPMVALPTTSPVLSKRLSSMPATPVIRTCSVLRLDFSLASTSRSRTSLSTRKKPSSSTRTSTVAAEADSKLRLATWAALQRCRR
jgi:hypothetical protein